MILTGIIIGLAFFTEATLGFGGGLIAVPLLALTMDVKSAVTLVLIAQFFMGFLMPSSYRFVPKSLKISMTAGLMLGTVLGMYSLFVFSDSMLRIALAVTILLFLVKDVLSATRLKETAWASAIAGVLGSWLQGLIGTGGPVFTMYLSAIRLPKESFRATLIYLFFVTSVVRVGISASTGLFTPTILQSAAVAAPLYAAGLFLGYRFFQRIDERLYRTAVSVVLLVSCLALLLKN